jgi:hypothetical protein
MRSVFVDGPTLALRLIRVRVQAYWNHGFRKARLRRRVLSTLSLLGTAAFLVFVLWAPQVGGVAVLRVRPLGPDEFAIARGLVGLGLLGYGAVLVYGSLLFSVSALLLDRDLEMLMVSPYPVAAVLAAKTWVRGVGLFAAGVLVLLPLLIGVPFVVGRPLATLAALLVLAAVPLLPVSVVSLAVMSVIRFVPANRGREVVGLLALLFAMGAEVVNIGFNPAFRAGRSPRLLLTSLSHSSFAASPWLPHGWGARAVHDALFGSPLAATGWTALVLAVGLSATWVAARLCARVYENGWSEYSVRPRRRGSRTAPGAGRVGLAPRLGRVGIDAAVLAVVTKDWRTRRRDLVMLMRMILPVVALGLFAFRGGGALGSFTRIRNGPLSASLALAPIPLVTLGLATALGLTAMSLEGGAIWMYAVSPNSLARLLRGKILVAAPPVAGAAMLAAVYTEFAMHPGLAWALPAVVLAAVFGASLAVVMVAVGGIFPRFNWTDPRRMISPVGVWVGLVVQLAMIVMVAVIVTIGVILGRLGLAPPGVAYGAAVLLAGMACAGMAAAALSAAGARLSGIEYGHGISEQSLT